jgi:hypothetical protein
LPQKQFSDQKIIPQPIARFCERWMVRVVRAAHKVEPRLLHEPHVPLARGSRDADSPAGVILMQVRAAEVQVLAVEEEPAVGGPFEPADAEWTLHHVDKLLADIDLASDSDTGRGDPDAKASGQVSSPIAR